MKKYVIVFAAMFLFIFTSCVSRVQAQDSIKPQNKKVNTAKPQSVQVQKPKLEMSRGFKSYQNIKVDKVYYTDRAVVLTYHHISDKYYSEITIKPDRFEQDLQMLMDKGFNIISLRQMINCMEGKDKLPANAVVITFDDGIESFYKYAYPLLKKYEIPATNFVITTRTESYKPSKEDYNPLSPAEIKEMYESGLIDIQSHTHDSHEKVYINADLKQGSKFTNKIYDKTTGTLETDEEYTERITDDLTKSRDVIYKYTGQFPDILCFPFGIYNKKVIDISKSVGFKYFVTTQEGNNKQDSNSIKINRIRAGEWKFSSDKVFRDIVNAGKGIRISSAPKTKKKAQ